MKRLIQFGSLGLAIYFGIHSLTACSVNDGVTMAGKSTAATETSRGTAVGQTAPDFELDKTDGTKIALKDLKGAPAVVVFWTAWCPACKEEAPKINQLAAEFEPKGVKVVGINIGESDARITEGIKDFGIKYAIAKDRDTSVSKQYKVIGTPTILILDKNGVVQYFGNELPTDYPSLLVEKTSS